ncbi:MAG: gliding motility-associated C-terminal domain-containing protein, partial [Bacteroidia bacterium]
GGTPNYTGTGSFSGLTVGTYNYTITDANACTASTSITITEPTLLVANATANPILCNGGTTTVAVSGSGGTPAYAGTGNFVVGAGAHTYPITDANGCAATATITLTEPTLLTASITASTNISCNGVCDGSATAAAAGGTPNYSYSWSNGQTTATLTGACAGTYTCYVSDANGCQTTVNVTLTQPAAIALTTSGTNISCYNVCDGAANVSISGGTSPYSILWSNNATSANILGLCANTYNVTVTDTNACQATASITLTQPTLLTATITASSNVTCFGLCNGSATVVAAGGTAPYTILWSNNASSGTIGSLCAGTYTATITDANGCQATASAIITEPSLLTATISNSSNVTCNGTCDGAATVGAAGGTAPYTYSWSNGQTTSSVANLCAANYTVTVIDANGCQATAQVTITQPAPLSGTITSVVNANCANQGGAASVSASGGSGAYIFSWSLAGNIVNVTTGATSTLTNIGAGLYDVIIKDQANVNCSTSISVNIGVTGLLSIGNQVQSNVTCNGLCNGTATVLPTGGTGTYTYSWSNGQTASSIGSLCAGTYTVWVTDAQNTTCQASTSFNIIEPMALQANVVSFLNPSCDGANNGSISVNATGGWGNYTYDWSNGMTGANLTGLNAGTYTVFVSDGLCSTSLSQTLTQPTPLAITFNVTNATCVAAENGAAVATVTGGSNNYTYSWSNGTTQPNISSVATGTYTLYVNDLLSTNCNITQSVTIASNPDLAVQLAVVQQPSCNTFPDGSLTVEEVTGGSNAYTYTWNTSTPVYNPTISGLIAGTYTITVQDVTSPLCFVTQSIDLTGGGVPPTDLVISPQGDQIICQDNFVQLQVAGTGALTYVWMRDTDIVGVGNLHSAVLPGHYYVIAFSGVNSSGCSAVSDSVWVDIKERPQAEIFTDDPVFACKGERIELNALGGDTYQWMMNGQPIAGANQTLYWATETGMYHLIASNVCGSDTSTATAILFSEGPTADFSFTPPTPFQNQEIQLIDASTNVKNWTWAFGDNATSNLQNPTHSYASDGTYQIVLTVSDAYGCIKSLTKDITVRKSGGLYIPNVFTPNGDNVGEEWSIEYSDVTNIDLAVFDRWGKYVYQSDDISISWNGNDMKGTPCEQGTYFYILKGKDAAGNVVTYKGNVTLLR